MYDMLYHIHPLQCAVSCIFVTACARVLTVNCSGWNNGSIGSTGDTMAMDDSDANEADAMGYTTVTSADTTRSRQRRHLRRRLDIGCHCNSNGGRWRWRRHLTAVICDGPPLSMTGWCCMSSQHGARRAATSRRSDCSNNGSGDGNDNSNDNGDGDGDGDDNGNGNDK